MSKVQPIIKTHKAEKEITEIIRKGGETAFLTWENGRAKEETKKTLPSGTTLVPYSAENNLLTHQVVLLPSGVEEYGSQHTLIAEIRSFIHRYLDISERFEAIASYYVLFSWVHDEFNELPYLRARGDYGSGKTRFLQTVGALCFKPIFASGASTVSPLFRILDAVQGTLVIDEADFKSSDERAEITKILNNGNARGFPVLRSEVTPQKEFNPRAFHVFGPKLIATRNSFEDQALESRCLTEDMDSRAVRADIPLNLPKTFETEALDLRNKLLLYRFRNLGKERELPRIDHIEPRLAQVFAPLIALVDEQEVRHELLSLAEGYSRRIRAERKDSIQADVLACAAQLLRAGQPLLLKDIAGLLSARFGSRYAGVSSRWVGSVLRSKLNLTPVKSHGNYMVSKADYDRLYRQIGRYGDMGSLGTKRKKE